MLLHHFLKFTGRNSVKPRGETRAVSQSPATTTPVSKTPVTPHTQFFMLQGEKVILISPKMHLASLYGVTSYIYIMYESK